MTITASTKQTNPNASTQQQPGLRRSCMVCRLVGLALMIGSVLLLLASSAQMMDIGFLAAFGLCWLVGAGATLVILSVSALRQTSAAN